MEVTTLVNKKVSELGIKLHQPEEWTVIAGIIKIEKNSKDVTSSEVVALGLGLKCLPACSIPESLRYLLVRDMHAETLCRRSFIRYLLSQYEELKNSRKSILEWDYREGQKNMKAVVREGISFVMYLSQAPCGDGTMHLLPSHNGEENENNVKRVKLIRGRDQVHLRGLRTKPGRADSPPTNSLSCTDKIVLWNVVGWQGSIAMNILKDPIYVKSIIIDEDYDEESLKTYLVERSEQGKKQVGLDNIEKCETKQSEGLSSFKYSRQNVLKRLVNQTKLVPSSQSFCWFKGSLKFECLVDGRRLGSGKPKDGTLPPKSRSYICTLNIAERVSNLMTNDPKEVNVIEMKRNNVDYQEQKKKLFSDGNIFEGWPVSDPNIRKDI